ncbi:MAG: RNA 2',3'-cyclic phosphodiesterase [Nanopusillaceae archaeon]
MRVFIAIDLPEEIKNKIVSYYREIRGVNGKFVEKENLHITLKFIGELQPNIVEKISEELKNIKFSKFKIEIEGFGNFNNRVLWFGIKKGINEIITLKREIDKALKKFGFYEEDFHPHITIFRIKQILSKSDYEHILEKFSSINIGEFVVEEFSLKQSILRREGPLYIDVAKYKLI